MNTLTRSKHSLRSTLLLPLLLIVGLIGSTASAETQPAATNSKHHERIENASILSGMALGAMAGGPPGAIIGASIGALLGDGHQAREQVGELRSALAGSEASLLAVQQEAALLQRRVQLAEQQLASEKARSARLLKASLRSDLRERDAESCCDNTIVTVHFRSGSSEVEGHYQEQLASLARLSGQMPTPRLQITGFADRSGDAQANLKLSKARAEAVGELLLGFGVPRDAISTVGVGDSQPLQAEQYFETDFFDRRVHVRLRDASQQFLSQNPQSPVQPAN